MFLLIAADWLGVVGVDCIGSEIPSSSVLVIGLVFWQSEGRQECFLLRLGPAFLSI